MAEKKNAMVAVYNTHIGAEAGIKELQKVGFAMKKLSIVGVCSRMSDLRGLPAATGQEGARSKHISTSLPCRISIYGEDGKTILATLKPTTLLSMFSSPQLKGVAQEVEDTIAKIMKEAATAGN